MSVAVPHIFPHEIYPSFSRHPFPRLQPQIQHLYLLHALARAMQRRQKCDFSEASIVLFHFHTHQRGKRKARLSINFCNVSYHLQCTGLVS